MLNLNKLHNLGTTNWNSRCLLVISIGLIICLSSCHTHKKNKNQSAGINREEILIKKQHPVTKEQEAILEEAYSWLGTPYKYAAQEKGKGTDCSGLVMMVYEVSTGEKIPRNSAKQAEYCEKIEASEVDKGDLVFFATGKDPNRVSHVGIIVDTDSFIHASSSKGVIISDLKNNYYQRTFKMYGRVPRLSKLISEQK